MSQAKPKEVQCVVCNTTQPDKGMRQTCCHCGMEPLPSYLYTTDCAFHPLFKPEIRNKKQTLKAMRKELRAKRKKAPHSIFRKVK